MSKFLAFSNKNQDLEPDLRVEKFLNQLKSQKKIADWQVRQGDEALRLQNLLGHKCVETTMIYTHVVRDMVSVPQSPLDNLYAKKPV